MSIHKNEDLNDKCLNVWIKIQIGPANTFGEASSKTRISLMVTLKEGSEDHHCPQDSFSGDHELL